MENKTHNFSTFISASPALWYNDFYLKKLPGELSSDADGVKHFISVGGLEDSTWSVKPLLDFTTDIKRGNIQGLEFQSHVYNDLEHMDVSVLSFTKGLQAFPKNKN